MRHEAMTKKTIIKRMIKKIKNEQITWKKTDAVFEKYVTKARHLSKWERFLLFLKPMNTSVSQDVGYGDSSTIIMKYKKLRGKMVIYDIIDK
jgi:YesN/AraC family two-component response regulator